MGMFDKRSQGDMVIQKLGDTGTGKKRKTFRREERAKNAEYRERTHIAKKL